MRNKHPVQAKAAAVKAATQGRPGLVFAASDSSVLEAAHSYRVLNQLEFTVHACADCGTTVKASAHTPEPFCITCGSSHTHATKAGTVKAGLTSDAELIAVQCSQCNTPNVLEARVVKAANNSFHCAACGTHVNANAEAPQPGIEPGKLKMDSLSPTDIQDHSDPEAVEHVTADGEVDDIAVEDFGANLDDALDDTIEDAAMEDFGGDESLGLDDTSLDLDLDAVEETADWTDTPLELDEDANVTMDDSLLVAPDFISDETEGLIDQDNGTIGEEFRVETDTDMTLSQPCDPMMGDVCYDDFADGEPILAVASLDDTAKNLHFVQAGNRVLAMKGQFVVASLTKQQAGKNADLFGTDALIQTVSHQVKATGLRRALSSFGFVQTKVPSPEKASVSRQIASVKASVQAQAVKAAKEQADCFAIAAAGLARNLWKNAGNPLRSALEAEFQRLGVRNAKPIVASLLSKHGVAYSKTLIETASKLQGMSSAARKEFADMLDMVSDAPVQDTLMDVDTPDVGFTGEVLGDAEEMPMNDYGIEPEDDFGFTEDDVTARFTNPASTVRSSRQVPVLFKPRETASSHATARAHEILSGGARLGFDEY